MERFGRSSFQYKTKNSLLKFTAGIQKLLKNDAKSLKLSKQLPSINNYLKKQVMDHLSYKKKSVDKNLDIGFSDHCFMDLFLEEA